MNRRIIIILIAVFFILALIGANYFMKIRSTNLIDNSVTEIKTNEKDANEININEENDKVLEVNSNTFEKEVLQSDKKVLIDFYATWCGPCQMLSPIVEEVAKEQQEVKFVKVDVDENEDLANEYGIYSIPTLVVIEKGEEINRSVGLIEKEEVEELIKDGR